MSISVCFRPILPVIIPEINRAKYVKLGCPIPLDEHAVSVSMPKWADVVGYEEGDPEIVAIMKIGMYHSVVYFYVYVVYVDT